MMKKTLLIDLALLALCAPAFAATTSYCDCQTAEGSMTGCVAGNNANPGTRASPKQTLTGSGSAQATANAAANGDIVEFCKGGAWNADTPLTIKNTGLSASGSPLVIDSYVSPNWTTYTDLGVWTSLTSTTLTDSTKSWTTNQFAGHALRTVGLNGEALYMPIASNTATTLTFTEAWRLQPQVADAYTIEAPRPKLSSSEPVNIIGFTSGEAVPGTPNGPYLVRNISIWGKGSTDGGNSGVFMNRSTHDLVVDSVDIRGVGGVGFYFGDAGYESGGTQNISLTNSQVYDTGNQGALGGANSQRLEGNSFDNCGFNTTGPGNHCIYLSNDYNAPTDVGLPAAYGNRYNIIRNTLTRNSNSGSGCQSIPLVIHGAVRTINIVGNLLYETPANYGGGCWGISVHSGYTGFEAFEAVVIRGNTIVNMPIAIGVTAAPNVLIEDNNIHFDVNDTIYGGIVVPINNSGGLTTGDTADGGATIRNNTIYIKQGIASAAAINFGEFSLTAGSNIKVTNNLTYIGSSVSSTHSCNVLGTLSISNFTVFDYNLCHHQGGTGRWGRSTDTNSYANLAAAQAAGFDTHGLSSDPLFATTPSIVNKWSCALQSGSPAVDAGSTTYKAPLGIDGKPPVNARDIGACER